jgi:polysaccharide biosynthesis/export protein
MIRHRVYILTVGVVLALGVHRPSAQRVTGEPNISAQPTTPGAPGSERLNAPPGVTPPPDYTIGSDDVLTVVFWQDKEMSGDVTVRPDGRITLPLINELRAAGLTPDQLRRALEDAGRKFLQEPNASVIVKQINSRKVFITGQVSKPGPYPLTAPTTILQLIATAGGLSEYADREHILLIRAERGTQTSYRFNYKEVSQQKRLEQNIELLVGDTVLVP